MLTSCQRFHKYEQIDLEVYCTFLAYSLLSLLIEIILTVAWWNLIWEEAYYGAMLPISIYLQ